MPAKKLVFQKTVIPLTPLLPFYPAKWDVRSKDIIYIYIYIIYSMSDNMDYFIVLKKAGEYQ